jgi:hypothetical protein
VAEERRGVDVALLHQGEQLVDDRRDHQFVQNLGKTELGPDAGRPGGAVVPGEPVERLHGERDRLLLVVVEKREGVSASRARFHWNQRRVAYA